MNNAQSKHAKERAEQIYRRKEKCIRRSFDELRKTLSLDEKLTALSKGKFKIRKRSHYLRNYNIEDCIIYDDEREFDQCGYDKKHGLLYNEYNNLLDELILGDEQKALELLRTFGADDK